jgi:hypothetical protein
VLLPNWRLFSGVHSIVYLTRVHYNYYIIINKPLLTMPFSVIPQLAMLKWILWHKQVPYARNRLHTKLQSISSTHPVIATLQARSGQRDLTRRGEPQDSRLTIHQGCMISFYSRLNTSLSTRVISGFRSDYYLGTNRPIYWLAWYLVIMIQSYLFKSIKNPLLWFWLLAFVMRFYNFCWFVDLRHRRNPP